MNHDLTIRERRALVNDTLKHLATLPPKARAICPCGRGEATTGGYCVDCAASRATGERAGC